MKHVMLDLETWGTEPGCDLRSIGAVQFNPDNGWIDFETSFYRAVDNPECVEAAFYDNAADHWDETSLCFRRYPLQRDPKTVEWWNDQSEAARSAFGVRIDLAEGLELFSSWYAAVGAAEEVTLWCNGPHFDEVILKAAYKACEMKHPWHYRAPRDFRTEMEGAGNPQIAAHGTAHDALDDAIYQALCVIECRAIRPAITGA